MAQTTRLMLCVSIVTDMLSFVEVEITGEGHIYYSIILNYKRQHIINTMY